MEIGLLALPAASLSELVSAEEKPALEPLPEEQLVDSSVAQPALGSGGKLAWEPPVEELQAEQCA